ncbi:MAG: glycosyltransferase family 2 protein [Planctomycetales bacterium]|nr:glycosyltransferase family 2 protein [Planctomycetales bacterium]
MLSATEQQSTPSGHATDADAKDVAVLITCFNRRETTLQCLRRLSAQEIPAGYRLRVLLTDDGSSDGTGDAVRAEFPDATVLQGDGNLYWCGGTMLAWEAARPADFYFWLNDDVTLRPGAVATLLRVYEQAGDSRCIVVGAACDPETKRTVTGGMRRKSWHDVSVIAPSDQWQPCDAINGNIVLVPRQADEIVGGLDPAYTHFFADGDFGMRARKAGIPIILAPGHLGECALNPIESTSFGKTLTFGQRWRRMVGPKGYRPPRQWWAFVRAHAPRPKVLYWLTPYCLFFIESLFGGRIRLRRNVRRPIDDVVRSV